MSQQESLTISIGHSPDDAISAHVEVTGIALPWSKLLHIYLTWINMHTNKGESNPAYRQMTTKYRYRCLTHSSCIPHRAYLSPVPQLVVVLIVGPGHESRLQSGTLNLQTSHRFMPFCLFSYSLLLMGGSQDLTLGDCCSSLFLCVDLAANDSTEVWLLGHRQSNTKSNMRRRNG